MPKINLVTLAANAARARRRLTRQQEKLSKLTSQIIDRVGTGGQSIQTNEGLVVVTAQTFDRDTDTYNLVFSEEAFNKLSPRRKQLLVELGVVTLKQGRIMGQAPKVQFRLT